MIRIEHLSYRIGTADILHDINLNISGPGITALIGPNGAGKSTLFSLMARLLPLQEGRIQVDDLDVGHCKSEEAARKISILAQDNTIRSRITVYDLLMFGRFPHNRGRVTKEDREIVDTALSRFDLGNLADRYLNELSGGQRQRALIAMTFVQQTPYVLLDEPLNNLDMFHARELMRRLRTLTDEENLTTVMVVHDINMAAAYADHIVVMKEGRILLQGTPAELITADNIRAVFGLDAGILDYHGTPLVVHHI